ncbi:hypothetical protein J2X01_003015 [Arthrobacter ginsengisoli]|uniref:LrgA family protein n=1 Tax=Arthrobacter ginsengisoli TaxID=1356565 RepID=A0ABU1UF05_9MICC|nr:hypothetical protein [Arthrobacter ginsengisoli]MDR7083720.1 hypothetical protein [Arthrobacter ginsengisoli]
MNTREATRSARAESVGVAELPLYRLHLMRAGYALMGFGLAVFRWPEYLNHPEPWLLHEGVVACLLTAMSLLAFLGLRYPVQLLPLLLFESAWKLIWLSLVAVPGLMAGDVDEATGKVLVSCSLVVVVLAVTPWRFVWQQYVIARGDKWR